MSNDRAFTPSDIPQKKVDYHGQCKYVRTSPDISDKELKAVNVEISFEEALRLSIAIQAAMLNLNRYNRNDKVGRDMGLCLTLYPENRSVVITEYRVRPDGAK